MHLTVYACLIYYIVIFVCSLKYVYVNMTQITLYQIISLNIINVTDSGKSLTYCKNNSGPRIEPLGTLAAIESFFKQFLDCQYAENLQGIIRKLISTSYLP